MRRCRPFALLTAAIALPLLGQAAQANLLINVDKSAQRMTVSVDSKQLYVWPVSTGRRGYNTPSGTFKPFRMDIDHTSDEWDNAPMPYSIFFTRTGAAIHGTNEQRHLGRAVSHGCVRLSVKNAATLWQLVKREKMANTKVVLSGTIPPDSARPAVARARPAPHSRPMPLVPGRPNYYAGAPRYAAPRYVAPPQYGQYRSRYREALPPPQYQPRYGYAPPPPQYQARYGYAPPPQYQRPYDDGPRLPFPFFLFGR